MPDQADASRAKVREAVILFADISDSVEVAHERSVEEYDDFIQQFQESALQAKPAIEFTETACWHTYLLECRGDEVVLVIQPKEDGVSNAVRAAVAYAIALKLNWVASPYNMSRLKNGQFPRDLSVGLHKGLVTVRVRPMRGEEAPEGFALSLCKRIQQSTRHGEVTHILASPEFESACRAYLPSVKFRKSILTDVKGIGAQVRAAELETLFYSDLLTNQEAATKALLRCTDDETLALLKQRAIENPGEAWVVRLAAGAHFVHARFKAPDSPAEARKFLETAIEIWPEFAEAHNALWSTLFSHGNLEDALKEYDTAIEMKPDIALADGIFASAVDDLAGVSNPAGVHTGLAEVYLSQGHYGAAIIECDKAIVRNVKCAEAYYLRAVAKARIGKADEAHGDYARACSLDAEYKSRPPEDWGSQDSQ